MGWELVGVTPSIAVTGEPSERLFFKRLVGIARGSQAGAAAAGATGAFGLVYFESGPDADLDGDVDGGLLDNLGDLFS